MNSSYQAVLPYEGATKTTFKVFQPHKATTNMLRVDSLAERKAQKLFVQPFLERNNLCPSHVLLNFVACKEQDSNQRDGSIYTFQLLKWNDNRLT